MVVVDSSMLIHLLRIGKLFLLKDFFNKIFITKEIYEEMLAGKMGVSEFEKACLDWIKISPKQLSDAKKLSESEGIAIADATVILLSEEKNDILLSNDSALIAVARTKNIKCWWPTSFILNCLGKKILTKRQAKEILFELIASGMRLRNDVFSIILQEIEKL